MKIQQKTPAMPASVPDASLYANRELSQLDFNFRVLAQAQDPSVPLLERLRFLCISCTNLDEFFEIRGGSVRHAMEFGGPLAADGLAPATLLNRILSEPHGQKFAVIVNEFGEIGIDNDLVVGADEEVFEMNNGCICCTVRGDLIRILGQLYERRTAGALRFDRVVIETTGLADPAPVAQTFFIDESVAGCYRLDGIVTVVDARHALPVPEGMTLVEAAALPEVYATGWLNLFQLAALKPGQKVLLHAGASGVGSAATTKR